MNKTARWWDRLFNSTVETDVGGFGGETPRELLNGLYHMMSGKYRDISGKPIFKNVVSPENFLKKFPTLDSISIEKLKKAYPNAGLDRFIKTMPGAMSSRLMPKTRSMQNIHAHATTAPDNSSSASIGFSGITRKGEDKDMTQEGSKDTTGLRGLGLGQHMYSRLAHALKRRGFNTMTSDRLGMTSNTAANTWKRLAEKYPEAVRKTSVEYLGGSPMFSMDLSKIDNPVPFTELLKRKQKGSLTKQVLDGKISKEEAFAQLNKSRAEKNRALVKSSSFFTRKLRQKWVMSKKNSPHAVFVVVRVPGGFAATTRAKDKLNLDAGVKYGFPGGKVDPGESPVQAAKRESAEEGWNIIGIENKPFYKQKVQGRMVWWFRAIDATKRKVFKEKGRITPVVVRDNKLKGFGNENAIRAYYSPKQSMRKQSSWLIPTKEEKIKKIIDRVNKKISKKVNKHAKKVQKTMEKGNPSWIKRKYLDISAKRLNNKIQNIQLKAQDKINKLGSYNPFI